ncbi:YycC family protein [Paenibacillus sp. GCM10023252]|uniref:YycC family protein n=1 Tax=Paenibacillus sp. GCM10023252 TaxID=3252649 RepID=UPI00361BE0DF
MTLPLQISAETALKLSKQLNVPVEHLMHMPKHILFEKLTALAKADADAAAAGESTGPDAAKGSAES